MVNIVDIYDNDSLIDLVAGVQPGLEPDPLLGIGRECYAFSPEEDRAFQVIEEKVLRLFEEYHLTSADFSIQKDGIGNLFVTLYGQDEKKSVMSGSHVDSVYMGGKYDGVAGVQSAYNFLRKLLEHQRQTKRIPLMNYTFAVFRAEESSPKTGTTCIGSRVATGTINQQELEKIRYKVDDSHTVSFKDHFILRYGVDRWNQILEEIKSPRLNKDNVVAYEELHIEQSAVCDTNDADVGVVIDGIGGSIRQMVEMNVRPDLVQDFEVNRQMPHTRVVLHFLGEEAHTGGTPPNPTFEVEPGVVRYRKDALIAALQFVRTVIEQGYSSNVKFLDFDIPHEVGFTTVPAQQNIELAVPDILYDDFAGQLVWMTDYIQSKMGVSLEVSMDPMEEGTYHSYHQDIFQVLDIPLTVENEVRLKC